jgi:Succinyl-CoA ligase like flavodoxin domain
MRLIGPNCLGVMMPGANLNASFAAHTPVAGNLALITQSGAIAAGMVDWAAQRGVGFSGIVSIGDQLDVDIADLLDYFALDDQTRAILLYVEAIKDARKFMSAARAAARVKPVIVVKSGRMAQGAKAAATHTGALAGSDAVYAAAFRRAGILRVSDLRELFDCAETLGRVRPPAGKRLAILTNGGGIGVLAVDLMAAINYGPGLKSMGWLTPHPENPKVMEPAAWANSALDALDKAMGKDLDHDAFSSFGKVTVTEDEVSKWGKAWALEKCTKPEQRIFAEALFGSRSEKLRQLGVELVIAASAGSSNVAAVRKRMAGPPSRLRVRDGQLATVANWRRVQCRQLFRLSLEAIFYWVTLQLGGGPLSSHRLVTRFMKQATGVRKFATTAKWIEHHHDKNPGPVELLQELQSALQGDEDRFAPTVMRALAFCLMTGLQEGAVFERPDRLPLKRVRTEFEQRLDTKPLEFMRHVLESWVFAQHVYWSIGRGLADARAGGKTILRLKVVLEDGGWTLTPGVSRGSFPLPTADRLRSALSLAHECGFVDQVEI